MAGTIDLLVRIAVDAAKAGDDIEKAASSADKFKSGIDTMVVPAAAAATAIGAFGKAAYDSASSAQQAMGAVDSVFGASSAEVKGYADQAATSVGLASSSYNELASVAGAQLQTLGVSQADAAKGSADLITMGADLAATFGGDTTSAVQALSSALKGEADPAERYGLALSQTAVNARMAADGTDQLTGEALTQAKAQTILAMAAEQSAGAVGQFGRESESAAGSAQIASAQWENAKAALGEALLPVIASVSTALGTMANWMSENTGLVTAFVAVIGTLAAGILAVKGAMMVAEAAQAAWSAAQAIAGGITKAYTAVQAAFNAVMAMNPIGLIIIAIVALIAGIVLLWNNCEAFRDFFIELWEKVTKAAEAAWNWIKGAAQEAIDTILHILEAMGEAVIAVWDGIKAAAAAVWDWITGLVSGVADSISSAIETAGDVITGVWNAIKDVATGIWEAIKAAAMGPIDAIKAAIDGIKRAIDTVVNGIQSAIRWVRDLIAKISSVAGGVIDFFLPGTMSSAAVATSAGSLGRSPTLGPVLGRRSAGGGTTVNVQLTGAIVDPVGAARQINELLVKQSRRQYGVGAVAGRGLT